MVEINALIPLQITMFLLMLAGYVMTKLKILPVESRGYLTDLVIDFILPCNIIVSFLIEFNKSILLSCLAVIVVSLGIQGLSFVIGEHFYSKKDQKAHTVLKYATIVSNAGFLGNPVAQGLYGDLGLLYASVYLIPVRIFMWSAGISCFTGSRGKNVLKKVLTHPCIVAVGIGLIIMIFQISLPAGLEKSLRTAAACNTALSMIVIGNILAEVKVQELINKNVVWFSAVRLLFIPMAALLICRVLRFDDVITGVSTVLAGMPAPVTSAILASKYDGDEYLAVKIVFVSTILSLVTVPVCCMAVSMLMG